MPVPMPGGVILCADVYRPPVSRAHQRHVRERIERGIAEGGRVTTGGAEAARFESGASTRDTWCFSTLKPRAAPKNGREGISWIWV